MHLKKAVLALSLCLSAASAYSAPKILLVVGDSLSAEYGLTAGTGWVALLQQRLKTEHLDAQVINASISGETTAGGRTRLPGLLKQYHPAVVVLELGANDGLRGLPVKSMEENLKAMTDMAKQDKARVLIVGMRMPPNYGPDYTANFFGAFSKVAKDERVPLVPFMLEGVADKPDLFQADRLHPQAAAHPTILNTIWPSLAALLKTR